MKAQCSAIHAGSAGKQCRATKDLLAVRIGTGRVRGLLTLPCEVVIYLCPKHFEVRQP